jgi:hypothetical protein
MEMSELYINDSGELEISTDNGKFIVVGLDSTYFNDVFSVVPK